MNRVDIDRLESFLEEGPAVLSDRVIDDVRRHIHGARQRRSRPGWRIGPLRVPSMAAAVALAMIGLVVGLSWMGWQARQSVGDPPPSWSGPVRPDAAELPVLSMTPRDGTLQHFIAEDPRDAASGEVDIVRVHVISAFWDRASWYVELAEVPPPSSGLDDDEFTSFGLVFDTTGDGSPDYEVGVDNDGPIGTSEAWVIDLATGEAAEGVGVTVVHPDQHRLDPRTPDVMKRAVTFTFSISSRDEGIQASSPYYAFAWTTSGGKVTAWDYAADGGWLSASADAER